MSVPMSLSLKRALVAIVFVSLGACGGDDVSGPEIFGGFTPLDGAAVIMTPNSCDIPFVGVSGVSAIAIVLGDYPDMCGVLQQTNLCGTKASAKSLLGVAINGKVGNDAVGPAGPGTYKWLSNPPTGSFKGAAGDAVDMDANCDQRDNKGIDMDRGSITIDSVTADRVTGTMNLGFDNGEVYTQPFDVAICPIEKDVCDLFGFGCTNHVCVE